MDQRVLIIDHFDSFTFNLVGLLEGLGVQADVIQYGEGALKSSLNYRNIILSPGPGKPEDYPISFNFLEQSGPKKNVLGVCLGHQIIGLAFGASLKHQNKVVHGKKRLCYPRNTSVDSIYKGLPVPFEIGLYHSWYIVMDETNPKLEIRSVSEDGKIMGLKHKDWSIEGVQFHPESYMTSFGSTIIKNWLSRDNAISY